MGEPRFPTPPEKPPLRSAAEYEALLDPKHTLPKVALEEQDPVEAIKPGEVWRRFIIHNEEGIAVARILLPVVQAPPGTSYVVDINRYDAHKYNRYGRAAYVALIKYLVGHNVRLISGHSLSRDSHKIWEWMVDQGAARLVEDRGVNEAAHNLNYTTSRYEII